jgi:tripartite-type tricarboxylate transporter receptor subunit TctC
MMVLNRSRVGQVFAVVMGVLLAMTWSAHAEDYPSRPITVLVPFPPGGSSDIVIRSGAAGNVAAMAIKNAPPDGYLLMMGHTGTHAINPALYTDLKFDPVKDFQPITALIAFNNILVVPKASPAQSAADLVAFAMTKPEGLSYGSQGVGTGGHLLGELFAKHAQIKLVHVPYRGIAPAVTDTVAGRMDMLFSSYLSAAGHIESGALRMLAIAGTQRHPAFRTFRRCLKQAIRTSRCSSGSGCLRRQGCPRRSFKNSMPNSSRH